MHWAVARPGWPSARAAPLPPIRQRGAETNTQQRSGRAASRSWCCSFQRFERGQQIAELLDRHTRRESHRHERDVQCAPRRDFLTRNVVLLAIDHDQLNMASLLIDL